MQGGCGQATTLGAPCTATKINEAWRAEETARLWELTCFPGNGSLQDLLLWGSAGFPEHLQCLALRGLTCSSRNLAGGRV